ncbi:MAG: NOB1 family endonuclease [Nitrosotalea sp.]
MASKVLDATSFYSGIPFASQETSFTTPLVFEEIKHIKKEQAVISTLIESKRLRIIEPEQKFTEIVRQKAMETGDFHNLSEEDVSVIALCLQLRGELLTDDFATSNVAKHLNLMVFPVMTKGVIKTNWVYFCSGCEKSFSKLSVCPICGNKLRRKSTKLKPSSSPVRK